MLAIPVGVHSSKYEKVVQVVVQSAADIDAQAVSHAVAVVAVVVSRALEEHSFSSSSSSSSGSEPSPPPPPVTRQSPTDQEKLHD